VKLKDALVGRSSDGWMAGTTEDPVARASYTRYDVSRDGPGFALVQLSRVEWCPSPGLRKPGIATIRIGPVGIGPDKQPRIERVTDQRSVVVRDCRITDAVLLRPPAGPWRVEIEIAPTFTPHDVDPSSSDRRVLGAVLDARFQPLFEN
jgi:hypothetical protein